MNGPPPQATPAGRTRRARLFDAARILSVGGVFLIALPLIWPTRGEGGSVPMSQAIIYLFAVWFGLIVGVALFGARLRQLEREQQNTGDR